MLAHVHDLIRNKSYREAIIEIESGRGSSCEAVNAINLEYCLFKSESPPENATRQLKQITEDARNIIHVIGNTTLLQKVKEALAGNQINFAATNINLEEINFHPKRHNRIFITDSGPSALDLYRTCGASLNHSDVVLQLTAATGNIHARSNTVAWLRRLGLKCFLFDLETAQVHDSQITDPISLSDIRQHAEIVHGLAEELCLPSTDLQKNALVRLHRLEVNFLDDEEITKRIRKNLSRDKFLKATESSPYNEGVASFPKDNCEIYLKNKFYNITGIAKPSTKEAIDFFCEKSIHRNFYSELIASELNSFESNPKAFLSSKQTVVFLDPTCHNEESGISSYLVNMYKFIKMSRLVEQTLYIKNPWPSSEKRNRELFRKLVGEKFNPFSEYAENVTFFDSEAHYPGLSLCTAFKKICIVHCSSILAAKFNNKIPARMSASLISVMSSEVENIKSAHKTITPTVYHDNVQKSFYRKELPGFTDYKSDNIINYIHDEYIKYTPFRDRTYDLVFIGRPQVLKGFDILLEVARASKDLKIAVITNGENSETNELKSFKNVTLYFDATKDVIYKVLNKSKALIDLSPHHNCSTVLLESMNAKTPAIIRDLDTYHEIIKDRNLLELFLLVTDVEIAQPSRLAANIIKHLEKLSRNMEDEFVEKIFNKFMLERYVENYNYYAKIFSSIGFRKKGYITSPVYEKYLKDKRVVNVVHSNALSETDGKTIDSYDVVVRFNRAVENIVPLRHGSRTDILYSCLNRSPESGNMTENTYNDWVLPTKCWLAKAYPNLQWTGTFSFNEDHQAGATSDNYRFEVFNQDPLRTSEFSDEWFKLIEVNIKSRPNTGVIAILDLLQYSPKSIYLKGYTFFKGGYDKTYRKQNEDEVMSYMARAGNHDQYRQNLFVRKILLTENVLEFDSSLSSILDSM